MKSHQGSSGCTASQWLLFGLLLFLGRTGVAIGEAFSSEQNAARQLQRLEQQQRDRHKALMPEVPDIHLTEKTPSSSRIQFPEEKLCFTIHSVALNGQDGGNIRTATHAVVGALQALAGGDIQAALAQGVAPYLAAQVKNTTTGGKPHSELSTQEKLNNVVAHALLGGVIADATGELAAPAIALALYGTADNNELTSQQKENLSSLAPLASGIAAGVSGDSTAGAVVGAQVGKNAVENNLFGGNKVTHSSWVRQHGVDIASCADNPGGNACQKAKNERDAVGLALATGSVALLPGGAQAMWGLGAGANAGISYLADGTIAPANAAIAGWVNVISMGNGLAATVG